MVDKKRLCLFAGYNRNGQIDDYVIYYVKELSALCDVFYYGDFKAAPGELEKLKKYTVGAKAKRHCKYDFGSWQEAVRYLGWEYVSQYDELLLVNDSCYGPLFSLKSMFKKMETPGYKAWAAAGNHFLMSFFVVLDKSVFNSSDFRYFMDHIKKEDNKNLVIKKYERGLNDVIAAQKGESGCYLTAADIQEFCRRNKRKIQQKTARIWPWYVRWLIKFNPRKVRLYEDDAVLLLLMGFPFVKKLYFTDGYAVTSSRYLRLLEQYSGYAPELITASFDGMKQPPRGNAATAAAKAVMRTAGRFFFEQKYKKNKYMIRIFKIPVFCKKMNYKV